VKRIWPLCLILFLSACASSTDLDQMRSEVYNLQRSSAAARKDIDALKENTTGVVREDSFTAVRESQTDLFAKVNETSRGLQELRGRFDENRYFTEKSLKDFTGERDLLRTQMTGLETQIKALKDRIALLENQGKPIEPSAETQKLTDTAKTEPVADSKTNAYDAAYQLFKEKKFKESREKFEVFIKDHPRTDLTDNAQFWIAESYYAEKDFENAILAYETLIKKYPDSDKASGGLLKQSLAFAEIGDVKTSRIILKKLIEKYPDSKDAELAKKKIAEIDKKPPKKK